MLQRSAVQAGDEVSAEDVRALGRRCIEALGAEHSVSLYAASTLGELLWKRARHDEAAEVLEDVIDRRELLDDPSRFYDMQMLAQVYHEAGRIDEAQAMAENAGVELAAWRGEDDPHALLANAVLARILMGKGRFEEAASALPGGRRRRAPDARR